MKNRTLFPILTFVLILPGLALAAKGAKGKKGAAPTPSLAEPLKAFDTNSNHQIDGDEIAAVKKAFADNPKGQLASLDKNASGTIEDGELAASPPTAAAGKGAKPGRALKKADKNGNNKIDADEAEALRKIFEADPKGALASLDHNSDGKLDEKEIARLNKRLEKGGHGKTGAASPTATSAETPKTGDAAKPVESAKPAEKPEAGK